MMSVKKTLKKSEILCSHKQIEYLLQHGYGFVEYPFKITWRKVQQSDQPVKVAFSVPKKKYKKAVHRNLLKRRMREAYRQNKEDLLKHLISENQNIHLFFVYIDKEIRDYHSINTKIIVTLSRLIKEINREKGS